MMTPMIELGFHTDAFNSCYWNFGQCLEWGARNGLHFIECGAIDGVSWIHGLGYQPHIALWEDPVLLRRKMDGYGIRFSQLDAAFPLSLPEGATLGVEYILHSLRWAKLAGCPRIDTTDDRDKPAGATDREVLDHMRRIYRAGGACRRSLRDHHQHRAARLLHHQAGLHGGDALLCRFALAAHEHGHRQHVHCRPGPRVLPGAL